MSDTSVNSLLVTEKVIQFGFKTKEANREYERSNNTDFDRGVYH